MESVLSLHGFPGATTRVDSTDEAQGLTTNGIATSSGGRPAVGILITCETNDIRFALGGTVPTQGASGEGHILVANQSLLLMGGRLVRTFQFISAASGVAGALVITPLFEYGG